jgi:hypothetical protein
MDDKLKTKSSRYPLRLTIALGYFIVSRHGCGVGKSL